MKRQIAEVELIIERNRWSLWADQLNREGRYSQADLIRATFLDPAAGEGWLILARQYGCTAPDVPND